MLDMHATYFARFHLLIRDRFDHLNRLNFVWIGESRRLNASVARQLDSIFSFLLKNRASGRFTSSVTAR